MNNSTLSDLETSEIVSWNNCRPGPCLWFFFQLFLAIHATSYSLLDYKLSSCSFSARAPEHCQHALPATGWPNEAHINYGRSRSVFLPLPFSIKLNHSVMIYCSNMLQKNCMLQLFHKFFHVRCHRIQASSAQRLLTTLIDASCKLDKSCLVLRQATQ